MTDLGEPIARGRTAEIYALSDKQVLKLCYDWGTEETVQYEARVARTVNAAGLPVPAVGEVLEIEGRFGLVYERVTGRSMFRELAGRPWQLLHHAHSLAQLHAHMHDISAIEGLPSQRHRLQDKIRHAEDLDVVLKETALTALERMPDADRLCHGDFHPDNVLITERGPVIIDWIDATLGNPLADVARTSIILQAVSSAAGAAPTEGISRIERALVAWFHQAYLRRYFQLQPGDQEDYRQWLPIIAAARMSEGITEIKGWLREQVLTGLT